jgi:hypothetical protein
MKPKIFALTFITATLTLMSAMAYLTTPFSGWQHVIESSSVICVISYDKPTPPVPNVNLNDGFSDSQVFIVSVLRGTNAVGSIVRFMTEHELRDQRSYLVFGQYNDNGDLCAYEDYNVVPLVRGFRPNILDGKKTLDEKLQILFQNGVDAMNQKIQEDEQERNRLQEALQK